MIVTPSGIPVLLYRSRTHALKLAFIDQAPVEPSS